MNTAIVYLSRECLEYIFKGLDYGYKTNLPKDSRIISIVTDAKVYNPLRFMMFVESSEFSPVAEGAEYPIFDFIVTRL